MRALLIVSLLLAAALTAPAQQPSAVAGNQSIPSQATTSKAISAHAAKPKLTDEQKRGLSLLETATASAGALEAPSRIVAYTEIARIYQKDNPKKAIELLQQAFESLQGLQFDSDNRNLNKQIKSELQQQVLRQYASAAPERLDAMVDSAEPPLRQEMLRVLLPYYEKNKNLDRPVAILMQLAVEAEMPYDIANNLMDKLEPAHPEQVRQLFLAALSSYQNHEHLNASADTTFADLISKAYGKAADQTVETAIDELLSQAKKADERNANVTISMGFDKGALQFKSMYDTQLFAVLPTLQKVDPEKAKELLKENEDVNSFASKYPQGMSSLNATGRPMSMGITIGNSAQARQQSNLLEEQRMNAVMNEATDRPKDALASAAILKPEWAMAVYLYIARANVRKNPTAAKAALVKAQDLLPQTSLSNQIAYLTEIISTYVELGEKEKAQDAIEHGTKTLAAMYQKESDADDPNLAPEAYWTSTVAWRQLIGIEYQLNPAQSSNLLQEAPDDEERVFAEIALASRMLGNTSSGFVYSMTAHKNGMTMRSMPAPEPESK